MNLNVLGMTLDQALTVLKAQGIEPIVSVTNAPGDKRGEPMTMRVVRVRDQELVVSAFRDGKPAAAQE